MNDNSPNSPRAPDPLDALLRESDAHLPDDGFTARVLTSLPPRRRFDGLRLAMLAGAWVAGVVILHARHGEVTALLVLAPVMIVLGSLVWALASWALEEWT